MATISERINQICTRLAADLNVELVHVEVAGPEGKPIIRVFIDKEGGVTHENCAALSHELGTILDVEDFIHSPYTLEVSSPGIERGLYKSDDYSRFAGSLAKVKTRVAVNGQRNFRGRIVGIENGEVNFEDRISGLVRFRFEDVVKANLEIDVEEEFRKSDARKSAKAGNPAKLGQD